MIAGAILVFFLIQESKKIRPNLSAFILKILLQCKDAQNGTKGFNLSLTATQWMKEVFIHFNGAILRVPILLCRGINY